jgi:hypothetical protein
MYSELQSCMMRSSRTIRFRTSFFASTCMTWACQLPPRHDRLSGLAHLPRHDHFGCCMLHLAALRSSWNSTPISSVSCLSSLPMPPGACASPAEGAGFGGGALRARPLRFFLFIVLGLNGSAMVSVRGAGRCQRSCAGCERGGRRRCRAVR